MGSQVSAYYQIKRWLKLGRWQLRRSLAAIRWGPLNLSRVPAVLGNAMPKSGSHLIIQVLQGLTNLGPFVDPGFPPVNRFEDNRKLPPEAVLANIRRMRSGDIGYGYLHAREPFIQALTGPGRATIFIYRDPRDNIVSSVFYATDIFKEHTMHQYYTETLQSMEARINAEITGVDEPGFELDSVAMRYGKYLGWLEQPQVLCLRFEDLILNRDQTLACLLDFLARHGFSPRLPRRQAVEVLKLSITPHKSGTFRKGQPGNWREHFSPANKELFKEAAGDLLIRLGYEQDYNW